jgi:hypothetical protein
MQTRTYGDLFKLIRSLAGVGSFATSELDDIANLINRRYSEAFNTSPIWPRYIVTSEERNISSLVLSGVTAGDTSVNGNYILAGQSSSSGDAVLGSNVYYQADTSVTSSTITGPLIYKRDASTDVWVIAAGSGTATINADKTITVTGNGTDYFTQNDGVDSDTPVGINIWSVVNSVVATGFPQVEDVVLVPYVQLGKDTIGEFNRIHRKKAFLNNSAIEYEFFVDVNGANILNITNSTDNKAFVTYKQQFSPFTTSSSYADSTEQVPSEFFHYIAHAAYADFLRMDGQTDKALVEEQTAGNYLALELEKIDLRSNNNTLNKRFSTYVNRQSR